MENSYYDSKSFEKSYKSCWYFLLGVLVILILLLDGLIRVFIRGENQSVVKSDTIYTERIVEKRDSFPVEKVVTVVKRVKVPVITPVVLSDSCMNDGERSDSAEMDLIQKEYSDDSTYTAYVSGLRYGTYPKLDSVIIRHKIIERTITNSVERVGLRFKLRPSIGGGYDPLNNVWGVYIGGAVVVDW